jgi:hypothetical protein
MRQAGFAGLQAGAAGGDQAGVVMLMIMLRGQRGARDCAGDGGRNGLQHFASFH